MTSKKTLQKYTNLIAGKLWTEQQIISFRSLLNNGLRHQPEVVSQLVNAFCEIAEYSGYELEISQQLKGLEWLKRTQLNSKGQLRRAKTTFLGLNEVAMLNNFSHFTMVGLYNASNVYHYGINHYVAVYRLHDTKGNWFDYAPTREGFEVLNISTKEAA
jgi:hypothetical protein